MSDRLVVHDPTGYPPRVKGKSLAPRIDALDGKVLYLVDARFDDSDVFLKAMQGWFADHMPGVETRFVQMSSVYLKDDPKTWEEIRAKGHAAIIGVGH